MKKLFTNDKFFQVMTIIGFVGLILGASVCLIAYKESMNYCLIFYITAFCLLFLYSSYKKHSKNVMKGLLGALLMAGLLNSFSAFHIIFPSDKVFAPVVVVAFAVLFITHFIINSDHHSSTGLIRLNQGLCVLLAIVWLVWNIFWGCESGSVMGALTAIFTALGRIGICGTIVCVESRLDAYRLDREAAGWTEEKGYPENYIHQKDR